MRCCAATVSGEGDDEMCALTDTRCAALPKHQLCPAPYLQFLFTRSTVRANTSSAMPAKIAPHNAATVEAFVCDLTLADFPVICPECNIPCTTPKGFISHLSKTGIPGCAFVSLNPLRNEQERIARQGTPGADDEPQYLKESSYLAVDPRDYRNVVCTAESCNRSIRKKDVLDHLTKSKAHCDNPLPREQVCKWKSHADGMGIRHIKRTPKTREELSTFEAACLLESVASAAQHNDGAAPLANANVIAPPHRHEDAAPLAIANPVAPPQPHDDTTPLENASAIAQPRATPPLEQSPGRNARELHAQSAALLAIMQHQIAMHQHAQALVHGNGIPLQRVPPVSAPTDAAHVLGGPSSAAIVTITQDTRRWHDTKDADAKKQRERGECRVFPWQTDTVTDVSAYKASMYATTTATGTRDATMGGLQQFLSLFNLGGASLQQFMEQLGHADGMLMPDVLSLNIMHPTVPWARKMMSAMHRVCKFHRSRATARNDNAFANQMTSLIGEYIEPRLLACSKAAAERLAIADEADYEWLTGMAPAGTTKVAIQEMMLDLEAAAYGQRVGLQGSWRYYGTVCMTGIIFMAQCNSRPGPWEHLTVDTLHEMKGADREYWTAVKGVKLLGVRGATGRYMSPGCVRAADVYCTMQGREGDRFWLYKFPKLNDKLNDACRVYLPGYSVMSPTSMRKYWETVMHHGDAALAEKVAIAKDSMCNAMDHGPAARDKDYVKGKAKKVAEDSKVCTIAYFDGVIEWPAVDMTDDELEVRAKSLAAKFAALACDGDGAAGGEGGDEPNDDDTAEDYGADEEGPEDEGEDHGESTVADGTIEGCAGATGSAGTECSDRIGDTKPGCGDGGGGCSSDAVAIEGGQGGQQRTAPDDTKRRRIMHDPVQLACGTAHAQSLSAGVTHGEQQCGAADRSHVVPADCQQQPKRRKDTSPPHGGDGVAEKGGEHTDQIAADVSEPRAGTHRVATHIGVPLRGEQSYIPGDAFASECVTSFIDAEKVVRRNDNPACIRTYLTPDEKRYTLTLCTQQVPLSGPGPGVVACRAWINDAPRTDLPAETPPKTLVELCKRFRRYMKLAVATRVAELQDGPATSQQVHIAPHPHYRPEHVRVALHLGVAPEMLVTPLPPDDHCLLYAPIAARDVPVWMESRNTVGYLAGEEMRDRQKLQEGAAKTMKRRLIKRTRAAGKTAEAARLELGGKDGWPGEDNFEELAELLGCRVQCFSLDNDNCMVPHAAVGTSKRFLLNVGHFKTGHFVLLAGSVLSDAGAADECDDEGGDPSAAMH